MMAESKGQLHRRSSRAETGSARFLSALMARAESLLTRSAVEFLRFSLVGLSGIGVNLGLYLILTRTWSLSPHLASPIAIEASVISNFMLNNAWTFGSRLTQAGLLPRLWRFHAVCALGGVVNYLVLLLLVRAFGWWDIYANLLGIAAAVPVTYAVNSAWTWRERAQCALRS